MLLISTSGVLGRHIDMPVPVIIGYRAILAACILFLFCKWKKISFRIDTKDRIPILVGGMLMGLHWITYFYALKMSNVAIGMLSLFTYPVITALLEPLVLKVKFQKMHLMLGVLVLVGIYFLVPDFSIENTYAKAVAMGVFSALCYALRNLIMKTKVSNYHGSMLMWYQLIIMVVLLSPALFIMDSSGIISQFPFVLILALLTTAIGHTLFLYSFKRFSATTASIIGSIQPVYGIILGIIFLREVPVLSTVIGGILILTSVVIESIRTYK
ncbi:drug/metabolite transporter (DMT)-like permease [Aquimarina sp. EL_43]|uniref:DMT family transporter n=1 Tax=Aquimarina TaxID=290174 RepID=UPI0004700976|nr:MULTISPECIES: DMT family transporter [Aquimarina]MBG6133524.1 drug/metabolite transporter (DMT)-like permease [Aquimarina sp. EL_35]MBG6153683.1 drug/metabolite transporter (DMT)-like permease [Aquimarina sp. EL_32]MBG6171838.1 drug/metabolite transporter (DMT)-like permease [Aquimarina sp. EL_43]